MRLAMLLALLAAAPLAAQSPRDTAAIRAAAADSGERVARLRIVADTAWAQVFDPRAYIDIHPRPGDAPGTAYGTAVRVREVRLERRAGTWVALRTKETARPR